MADRHGAVTSQRGADLEAYLKEARSRVDAALDRLLPAEDRPPAPLHRAMRYSMFAGGKRLRPILVLTAGRACGADPDALLPAACAVELIHTYSLIHDDLPAFDDDSMRRGKPTNHRVFGEAVAILAGDALQTLAFEHLARTAVKAPHPQRWVNVTAELAAAAGSSGMAGGQCRDLEAEGASLSLEDLRRLHEAKTGALITACLRSGALLAGADGEVLDAVTRYGRAVGLAFQIIDDVLDVEGSLQGLGKEPGGDAGRGKPTYAALLGVQGARAEAERLTQASLEALAPLGPRAARLAELARFVVERQR